VRSHSQCRLLLLSIGGNVGRSRAHIPSLLLLLLLLL
jgi:hypothetical protein